MGVLDKVEEDVVRVLVGKDVLIAPFLSRHLTQRLISLVAKILVLLISRHWLCGACRWYYPTDSSRLTSIIEHSARLFY